MPQVKQFELRIAKRPGLPGEIASALWQKGVHIRAFSAELQEGQGIFHLAVDKAAVAKQTFIENGWKATKEGALAQTPTRKPEVHDRHASARFVGQTKDP